jgi:hypothetical protein
MTPEQLRIEALVVENAALRADAQRLTWIIHESNTNGGWLADHVWDDATAICPVDYD